MGTRRRRLRGFGAEPGVEVGLTAGFSCEEARDSGSSIATNRYEVVSVSAKAGVGGEIDHISLREKAWSS